MTNIEQFTQQLMLAHDIDYWTALGRAEQFYENLAKDVPFVLNDWISVDNELPKNNIPVLIFNKRQVCYVYTTPFSQSVTHWQPLPEPPKEK